MKLAVLHLSDIHIHGSSDGILLQKDNIASAFYESARNSDASLIFVTGDIAFSGKTEEYEVAKEFLLGIKHLIEGELLNQPVDIIVTPGNHDCELKPENAARSTLIESTIQNPELANETTVIDSCTAVQTNFFRFRNEITSLQSIYDNTLWTEYELRAEGKTIRISSINAAWMSRIPEQSGKLIFPITAFEKIAEAKSDLRLSLIHHPLNWYAQSSYHPLRRCLRGNSNVILSGHEHCIGSGEIIDSSDGKSLYFEAPALQPHEKDLVPGFSCLTFNIDNTSVIEQRYEIKNSSLVQNANEITHKFKPDTEKNISLSALSPEMAFKLTDAGGNFTHPDKSELYFDDVFVYPELKETLSEKDVTIDSEILIEGNIKRQRVLILGEEKSGKTFLLYKYFSDLLSSGFLPLYINAHDLSSVSNNSLEKIIKRLAKTQYTSPKDFNLGKKRQRIVLLDDLDTCPGKSINKHKIISYLERNFDSVIMTGSISMELSELLDKDLASSLDNYSTYEIRSFGHLMRHKLIKKWCLCSDIETTYDLDRKVHNIESLIDNVIGKNLVPARPLYLLILLQSSQTYNQEELQSSGLSYYYQFLITKSLKENGVSPDKFIEMFNYISQIAWFFSNRDSKEIDSIELHNFNDIYSKKYFSVDFESRINLLCKAKILARNGNYYSFLYAYVYYFFLGKYLAANLDDEHIKSLVLSHCENLNKKKNASTILFLSHHTNELWLLEKISGIIENCYTDHPPLLIEEDVSALNTLVDSTSELIIQDLDIDRNQKKHHAFHDELEKNNEIETETEDEANEEDVTLDTINAMNKLLKTSEILGQITKNYYGSIERKKKEEYINAIFSASLRMLKSLFEKILNDPELFINELENDLKNIDNDSSFEIKQKSRRLAFNLIGLICTGMIGGTARYVSSEPLREDIVSVVSDNQNNAYKLIGAATRLLQPGKLPFDELSKLASSLNDNIFGFTILQSLVVYYIHMFHTTDSDKQKLCRIAKIKMANARSISLGKKRLK